MNVIFFLLFGEYTDFVGEYTNFDGKYTCFLFFFQRCTHMVLYSFSSWTVRFGTSPRSSWPSVGDGGCPRAWRHGPLILVLLVYSIHVFCSNLPIVLYLLCILGLCLFLGPSFLWILVLFSYSCLSGVFQFSTQLPCSQRFLYSLLLMLIFDGLMAPFTMFSAIPIHRSWIRWKKKVLVPFLYRHILSVMVVLR